MGRAGDQSFWGIGVPSIFGNMSEQPATGEANASAAVFGGGNRRGAGTGWWWHTPFDTLDKMDEQILVRDTRIYLQVVWRLLTDAVLPFDYAEHAAYLADELRSLQGAAGDRFDLSTARARAPTRCGPRRSSSTVPSRRASMRAGRRSRMRRSRRSRMRWCRSTTRPAIASARIRRSASRPIRRCSRCAACAAHPPGSDQALFLEVGMRRARNRVAYALREALAAIDRWTGAASRLNKE